MGDRNDPAFDHMKQFSFTPEVFSVEAAAHYLGVSKSTVEDYIRTGQLHTFRLPAVQKEGEYLKRTLIRKGELDRFIERDGVTI